VLGVTLVLLASLPVTGCYTTQLGLLRSGLDSLRTQVDTLSVRDSVALRLLADTRRDLQQQHDLLVSTRATVGSASQQEADQLSQIGARLDEVMHRLGEISTRAPRTAAVPSATAPTASGAPSGAAANPVVPPASAAAPGPDPASLYDQAGRDLTEGRYALALQGYRDVLVRFPDAGVADRAQYGVGECLFAQSAFDSAAAAYQAVGERWPKSDRAAASLYRLGLCQERLGRVSDAKKTFEELVRRFPTAAETGLARDRLGATHH
jgi:tol-pal system protein YbgF